MSEEISFDNNNNNFNYKSRVILGQPETPKMVRFLIGKGIVKSEKQAIFFMTTLSFIFIALTIFISFKNFSTPTPQPPEIPLRNYPIVNN